MIRFCLHKILLPLATVWVSLTVSAQITPPHLCRTPDIHGDRIVFSAEGDLWLGYLDTGRAMRLTTFEGTEWDPRFSPDGKWIAFTGEYDGGQDVYVMPADGGAPRRLTFDPAVAEVEGWTPDGTKILFRSARLVPHIGPRLWLVPLAGGLPEPLPMERAAQGSFAPDGKRLAFCRLPLENHNWKRYRGGMANHVWIADLDKKTFRRINDEIVNEQYPVWAGNDIYYVSEKDGTANLWRYDPGTGQAVRVTSHTDYDVRSPSGDGQRIVFEYGNSLRIYDCRSGQEQEVTLALASDRIHTRPFIQAGALGRSAQFSLGPSGKRLLVEERGQLFTIPAEKGEVRPVAPAPGSRSKSAAWSPDGKWLAFVSDRSGEENLWLAPAAGGGDPQRLTDESGLHLNGLEWSPDSKRLAFRDNAQHLWILELDSHAKTEVAHSDFAEITDYRFSPDGKWLAYARPEGLFVVSLYLYDIAGKSTTRLTGPPTRDHQPVFDPAGKYLYFLTERNVNAHEDGFDFQTDFDRTTKIYALTLAADTASPLPVESDEEPGSGPEAKTAEAKAKEAKPAEGKAAEEHKPSGETPPAPPKLPDVKVNLDGIAGRLVEIPVAGGRYTGLEAVPGKLMYLSPETDEARPEPGAPPPGAKLKMFDFEKKKETELADGVLDYALSLDGKKMAVRTKAGLQVADAGAPVAADAKAVNLDGWLVEVNPELEWRQIFEEAWRNHRDTFYDPKMHGMDWEAVRRKYEALLPAVGCRQELNRVIGDMEGELNVSHEFVRGGSSRPAPPPAQKIAALGADLDWDAAAKAFRIARIYPGDGFDDDARSPLLAPGLKVKEGEFVLAINGLPLRGDEDPAARLIGQGGKIATLLVNGTPSKDGARTVRIKAGASDAPARYYGWVDRNREYVRTHGGSNLAYLHLPDMSDDGMVEFSKHFYANLDKDGMVIDVRYNHGGITSGQVLERLRRVIFEYDQSRYGQPEPYHRTGYLGRVVVVCNENTSSDGEYFCTGFRYMKLGPTVGTRTWGGFAAVAGIATIDGGMVASPIQGSFTPEGKWLPDGYGFNPDYVVDEDPNAFVAGRDAQLDKAIELLQEEIRRDPPKWPHRLDPPSAQKAFAPNK
jgi:tricorn protease